MKHTAVGHEAAGKTGEPPESTPPLSWFPPGCAPAHLGKWLCPSLGRVRWCTGPPAAVPFSELSLPVGSAFCHTAHSFCSNTRYCRRRKIAGKTGQSYQNNNKQPHQHASAMFCLGLSRNQRMYCRKTTKHRMVRSRPVMDILLALGRALHCLRKQWPYLICFLEDGRLNRATTGRSAV